MDQLSLVFFTVLAQVAVGMFIALGLFDLAGKPSSKTLNKSMVMVWGILAIAALASMTHLGQPQRMFNVLTGVTHGSPLSLEIVALSLFGGTGVVYTGLRLLNIAPALRRLVLIIAMILGVILIKAIANVYTLPTIPTWDTGWTTFQFMMTAAVAGPVGAALLLRLEGNTLGQAQLFADKALALTGAVLMTIAVAGWAGYLVWLGQLPLPVNPFTIVGYQADLVLARTALLMAGLLIWIVSALIGSNRSVSANLLAFGLVVTSELLGRVFFYDMMISAGTGM